MKYRTAPIDATISRGISFRNSEWEWIEEEAQREFRGNRSRVLQEALALYRSQRENGHGAEVRLRRDDPDMDSSIQRDPIYYDVGKL
jgi:hypothetical protein